MTECLIPRLPASFLESSTLMSEVNLNGIMKVLTLSGPIASAAIAAVKAESIPPEEPIKTPGK